MEPTQSRKPRKRRRWLIVALLLVLVSGVSWWNWPRGDARFVGKWDVTPDEGSQRSYVVLKANGTGFDSAGDPPKTFNSYSWRVTGEQLVLRSRRTKDGWLGFVYDAVDIFFRRESGRTVKLRIEQVEPDKVVLKVGATDTQRVWKRIPE